MEPVDPIHAGTTEQFHENGYFADPQTINELAQYWEDQRNIDSLLGDGQEQHSTDESSMPGTAPGDSQQGPLEIKLNTDQHPVLQQSPEDIDPGRVSREQSAADETTVNPLSGLVNYDSSDDES